jgi:hypothetical protein
MCSRLDDLSAGSIAEAGRRRLMVYDPNVQTLHCSQAERWFSTEAVRWSIVWPFLGQFEGLTGICQLGVTGPRKSA